MVKNSMPEARGEGAALLLRLLLRLALATSLMPEALPGEGALLAGKVSLRKDTLR